MKPMRGREGRGGVRRGERIAQCHVSLTEEEKDERKEKEAAGKSRNGGLVFVV
jgi:hypothetical protein